MISQYGVGTDRAAVAQYHSSAQDGSRIDTAKVLQDAIVFYDTVRVDHAKGPDFGAGVDDGVRTHKTAVLEDCVAGNDGRRVDQGWELQIHSERFRGTCSSSRIRASGSCRSSTGTGILLGRVSVSKCAASSCGQVGSVGEQEENIIVRILLG